MFPAFPISQGASFPTSSVHLDGLKRCGNHWVLRGAIRRGTRIRLSRSSPEVHRDPPVWGGQSRPPSQSFQIVGLDSCRQVMSEESRNRSRFLEVWVAWRASQLLLRCLIALLLMASTSRNCPVRSLCSLTWSPCTSDLSQQQEESEGRLEANTRLSHKCAPIGF